MPRVPPPKHFKWQQRCGLKAGGYHVVFHTQHARRGMARMLVLFQP